MGSVDGSAVSPGSVCDTFRNKLSRFHRYKTRGQGSPARDSSHAGLVLRDYLIASWVVFGEELAGRGHEVGGYPAVRTRDVGGFRIVSSVARVAPLSDTLRGGGRGQVLERRECTGRLRESRAPGRKERGYTHLTAGC